MASVGFARSVAHGTELARRFWGLNQGLRVDRWRKWNRQLRLYKVLMNGLGHFDLGILSNGTPSLGCEAAIGAAKRYDDPRVAGSAVAQDDGMRPVGK